ncbi:hypothetical protein KIL84_009422 [Mauremys mutica]|uniref:Uncharacterized protein n=1 Tax=Mauremys mutica TaxID=74926 RepID=A0A9D4B4V1_9SAUR|nr:hypothetical protein KIL84_009422 [Mauremys mutica]
MLCCSAGTTKENSRQRHDYFSMHIARQCSSLGSTLTACGSLPLRHQPGKERCRTSSRFAHGLAEQDLALPLERCPQHHINQVRTAYSCAHELNLPPAASPLTFPNSQSTTNLASLQRPYTRREARWKKILPSPSFGGPM